MGLAATVTPEGLVLVNFCTADKDSEGLLIFTSIRLSPGPVAGMLDRVLSRMAMEKASGVGPGSTLVVSSASKGSRKMDTTYKPRPNSMQGVGGSIIGRDTIITTPGRYESRELTDCCECSAFVEPAAVVVGEHRIRVGIYRCRSCGVSWMCSWRSWAN